MYDHGNTLLNLIIASTPGGIEAQEAQAQTQLVNKSILPREGLTDEIALSTGIKILGIVDDLFYDVDLPEGWTKVATDHSMWSHLLDDKGRLRASIFYKGAFYDRSAHILFNKFYAYTEIFLNSSDEISLYVDATKARFDVMDKDGNVLFSTDSYAKHDYEAGDVARLEAKNWLNENYPDWENIFAYWT